MQSETIQKCLSALNFNTNNLIFLEFISCEQNYDNFCAVMLNVHFTIKAVNNVFITLQFRLFNIRSYL